MPPSRFGDYLLEQRIAAGGMAEVFLARGPDQRQVALKRILKDQRSPEFVRMFTDEACIASALDHPNVVRVHDYGQVDGEPFIAMEYVAGEPLARLIDRVRERGLLLPEAVACFIAESMCRGLAHAHALEDGHGNPLGLVHRDVSPQNVLVGYDGAVKVADFGVARAYAMEIEDREQTRVGLVKGKYLYFSPEQARARPLDGRTDVFAAGVVLYEMLCGRLPYDGEIVKVLFRVVHGEFSRPTVWRADLSPELEGIVLVAMATSRERRFPSADALGDALRAHRERIDPGFDAARLSELMRLLFAEEISERGLRLGAASKEVEHQLASWTRLSGGVHRTDATSPVLPVTSETTAAVVVTAPPAQRATDPSRTAPQQRAAEVVEPVPDVDAPWLVLDGAWAGLEFACIRTVLTVGRSRDADIDLEDPSVLPLHARLLFEGGAWRVVAASASARVEVNAARVRDGRVRPGDRLRFGNVSGRFVETPSLGAAPRRMPAGLLDEVTAPPPAPLSDPQRPRWPLWLGLAFAGGALVVGALTYLLR